MKNLKMYCISLNPDHLDLIKKLNYIPVGLGDKNSLKAGIEIKQIII